jgi:hypothetical protein
MKNKPLNIRTEENNNATLRCSDLFWEPMDPCCIFTACKRTLQSMSEMFVSKISWTLFLTRDSPASLVNGSGCWIRVIRMSVLRRQPSHLLLIHTNLGYGTVLTAACAHQGCNAIDYYYYYYLHHHYYYYNYLWTVISDCLDNVFFWIITPCNSVYRNQELRKMSCLHLQG